VLPNAYPGISGKLCEWIVVVQRTPNETPPNPEVSECARWEASSPRMAAMYDRAELDRIREFVGHELRDFERSFADRGLRVIRLEIDEDNGQPFPDLLVYLDCEDVEGIRILTKYLGVPGIMGDPAEVSRGLYIWSQEVTPAGLERLHRAPTT
jgi:hypothetical protein